MAMRTPHAIRWLLVFSVLFACAVPTHAQQDLPNQATYDAAVRLVRRAITPQSNGSYAVRMRALRQLQDPSLRPLFAHLRASPQGTLQVFGVVGLGQLSETGKIDIGLAAEISDPSFTAIAITTAIDDDMIDADGLRTILTWKDLQPLTRMIAAMQLSTLGEQVDSATFRPAIQGQAINNETDRAKLIEYAYAAALLTRLNDPAGKSALMSLLKLDNPHTDIVFANLLTSAMRNDSVAIAPLAVELAGDPQRNTVLRTHAMNAALRLDPHAAFSIWSKWFASEQSTAQQTRLAALLLDAAPALEPGTFEMLTHHASTFIQAIGKMGMAIASKDIAEQRQAAEKLMDFGVIVTTQWMVSYCRREQPENGAKLLEHVVRAFAVGIDKRDKKLINAASDAVFAMCELYPKQATLRIPQMLHEPIDDPNLSNARMAIVLDGISRLRGSDMQPLLAQIDADAMETSFNRWMHLLQCAKHGVALTAAQWLEVEDCIQGAGQITEEHRTQLAWLYLKHNGVTQKALIDATR